MTGVDETVAIREQAAAVRLAFLDGLSHSEISTRLGVPLGTVKSRVRLGLRRLERDLAELR